MLDGSSLDRPWASPADHAICKALLRGGSRTFFAASWVLPRHVRVPAAGLYAFCRIADDAIDRGSEPMRELTQLRARLDSIYAGAPRDVPADRAFADSVHKFAVPKAFPTALLEGFGWDAQARRYETLSQLCEYAVRVAGTVGAMMAMIMGVRERALLARACDLGVAMQLTNIARDVGEDARLGRLYLPLEWMRAVGLDPQEWLAKPQFDARLMRVIRRLLRTAQRLYLRADAGLARLPLSCRPGMHAARLLYAEIGSEVARRGYDSVSVRAVVHWRRKTRLLAGAVIAAAPRRTVAHASGLPEYEFLLDAVAAGPAPIAAPASPGMEERFVWVMQLFERLERREHPV